MLDLRLEKEREELARDYEREKRELKDERNKIELAQQIDDNIKSKQDKLDEDLKREAAYEAKLKRQMDELKQQQEQEMQKERQEIQAKVKHSREEV